MTRKAMPVLLTTALTLGFLLTWYYWFTTPTDYHSIKIQAGGFCFVLTLLGLGIMALLSTVYLATSFRKRSARYAALLLLGYVCVTSAYLVWARRYTALGGMVLGGANYWVARAAKTSNDDQALAYLRMSISMTQYGVNLAENAVHDGYPKSVQQRLFALLMKAAPNENWRWLYQNDYLRAGGSLSNLKNPIILKQQEPLRPSADPQIRK